MIAGFAADAQLWLTEPLSPMPNSMTGFASLAVSVGSTEFTWELRSVNHRFLDVSLRLPEEFRRLETGCRELIAGKLRRGKLDCTLRAAPNPDAAARPQIDAGVIANISDLQDQLLASFPQARPLSVADLLRFDGVIADSARQDTDLEAQLLQALGEAAAALVEARAAEGARIAGFLRQQAADIDAAVAAARPLLPEVAARYREKLLGRIERLDIEAQPERLEQELALIAQRLDIVEELDRLGSHTAEVADVLKRDEPIGRRLDFLIQELNREANTLSSKAQDEELTRIAVELKVVIEQMREQAQNLE